MRVKQPASIADFRSNWHDQRLYRNRARHRRQAAMLIVAAFKPGGGCLSGSAASLFPIEGRPG